MCSGGCRSTTSNPGRIGGSRPGVPAGACGCLCDSQERSMEERLHLVTKDTVVIIDAIALIIVAIGTAEAFFTGLRVAFPAPAANRRLQFRRVSAGLR